jgi:hypothetical protein
VTLLLVVFGQTGCLPIDKSSRSLLLRKDHLTRATWDKGAGPISRIDPLLDRLCYGAALFFVESPALRSDFGTGLVNPWASSQKYNASIQWSLLVPCLRIPKPCLPEL